MSDLYERHLPRLDAAWEACLLRHAHSPFPELPARYPGSEAAVARGREVFQARLGAPFQVDQPGTRDRVGEEISPYTQEPLGITYPRAELDKLFEAAERAVEGWRDAGWQARVGALMEGVERLYARVFEVVFAVMHTAGQSFNMAYAGSGVNALDRAIEALAHARHAMAQIPASARWERPFGRDTVRLEKSYRISPRGVAVCFACASFPTWNAWPSMMASLATGNAVIVKPHPAAVLPMALTVEVLREALAGAGFAPDLVTLAVDTQGEPIGKELVTHPRAAIVDFTGGAAVGGWVEKNAPPRPCFTETAGLNTVVLESCEDLDAVLRSLATTLCLFSAQMCTSPQNIYLPSGGVRVGPEGRLAGPEEVGERLASAIDALVSEPRRAGMIAAAIQSPRTLEMLRALEVEGAARGRVLRASRPYTHPEFPAARTATPLVLGVTTAERDMYGEERFGPVSFVVSAGDRGEALAHAARDVRERGGITAFLYSTDEAYISRAEDAYARAGAQLTINLTGPMPLNFAAAYSDYHVTGLNPAGNASLTDAAFVAGRFRITQSRRPVVEPRSTPQNR